MIQKSRKRRIVLLSSLALVGAGGVGLWWQFTPPRGARKTCEQFMLLASTNRCQQAYEMTMRPKYELNTVKSFCQEYGHDFNTVRVRCSSGEWQGGRYVAFGTMSYSKDGVDYPPISFGMPMSREGKQWVVHSVTFGDGP